MSAVRLIRPDEVDELFAMICELADYEKSLHEVGSSAEDFRVALFGPEPQLFAHVVEHDGGLAGFAVWYVNFSTWSGKHGIYLEDLYVRPELRGAGYGTALIRALARVCQQRGYDGSSGGYSTGTSQHFSSTVPSAQSGWTSGRSTG